MKTRRVLGAAMLLAALAFARGGSALEGGAPAPDSKFAYVVWLPDDCTGIVVAPGLLAYTAHCGSRRSRGAFGLHARESFPLEACREYDDWSLSNGMDVAFCRFAASSELAPGPRLATGAELTRLVPGQNLTLVGYGGVSQHRRSTASARLLHVGTTVVLDTHRVCPGDSGGAVLSELHGESVLVGMISAKPRNVAPCGRGRTHAVRADRLNEWIAAASSPIALRVSLSGEPPALPVARDAPRGVKEKSPTRSGSLPNGGAALAVTAAVFALLYGFWRIRKLLPSPLRQQQRVARSDRVLEQPYDLDSGASFFEERGAIEDHCELDEARQQVARQ
jgi:hypothetical protein